MKERLQTNEITSVLILATLRRTDGDNLKRELSHQDASTLPLLTRLTTGSQGWEARGRLHFPWAEPASETSQSVAWPRHWCCKGSGRLQSTKAFPTPQWVPDLPGQTEGMAAGSGAL